MGCCPGKKKGEKERLKSTEDDEDNEFITPDAEQPGQHLKKHNVLRAYASVHTDDGTCGKHHRRGKEKDKVKLLVTIKEAGNLRDADFMGQSDPYCIMEIADTHHKKPKVHERTAIIDDNREPQWNHRFECRSAIGDTLTFTVWDKDLMGDEILGKCSLPPERYYPFGFSGELRLEGTGSEHYSTLTVSIKILEKPPENGVDEVAAYEEKVRGAGLWAGLNFEEDNTVWRRAHDIVNCKEDEMGMQKEETNTSSIETLLRIAESGLPMPKHAMERLIPCLHATDKRYRLAALTICKALGSRCLMFEKELAGLLHDKDDDVQAGVIRIIGTFGSRAAPYLDDIGYLLHDEVPVVRTAALEALGIMSQADNFDALVVLGNQGLIHEDKRFRLATVLMLKSFGVKATPHAYSILSIIEDDPSIDCRIAATQTLGALGVGANEVQPAIAALYIVEWDEDPRVARAATMSLERLRTQGANLPPRPASGVGSEAPKPKAKAKAKPKVKAKSKAVPEMIGSPAGDNDHGHKEKKDRKTHGHKDVHKDDTKEDGHKHKDKKEKKGWFSRGKKDKDEDKSKDKDHDKHKHKHKDKDEGKQDGKTETKAKTGWFKKRS